MAITSASLSPPFLSRVRVAYGLREREVRDTLWLLATIVWVLLPHFSQLPIWCSVAAIALVAWRTLVTWTGRRLPGRLVLVSLMMICGGSIYFQFHTIFGKDAGVAFVVLLLGLKLLELRARRDIFVVIYLSLFVMLTGLFDAQSILSAGMLIVGLWLLMTALVSVNFIEREPSQWTKIKISGQLCLLAIPLMLVLFILFPRVEGPLWGLPADAYAARTGLSETMSPGSFSQLLESDEIAFRAHFEGRNPKPSERYWRGPVLGSYNGQTWRPLFIRPNVTSAPLDLTVIQSSLLNYTETLEPTNRPWIFLLDAARYAPEIHGTSTELHADLQVLAQSLIRERTRFEASSYTQYRYGLNQGPDELREWLTLPRSFNPRTIAFAKQLRAEETNDRKLVARVLNYFSTEQFYYTLTPPALGRNSVDEFLFDTRRGFCEHYAGAFVVLMRAMGIPSRVVTGYLGGDVNPVDGYIEIHQRDAHAWAEVWLPGEGWVRADPTAAVAPSRVENGVDSALGRERGLVGGFFKTDYNWMRTIRFNVEAFSNAWNQYVLGYTSDRQSSMLSGLGIGEIDWQKLTIALVIFFGGALFLVGLQVVVRTPRRDPVVRLYSKLCDRIAKRTSPRMPDEGPQAYLQRVHALLPAAMQPVARRAFLIYEQLRYARPDGSNPKLLEELNQCISDLRT